MKEAAIIDSITDDSLSVGTIFTGEVKVGMRVLGCGIRPDTFVKQIVIAEKMDKIEPASQFVSSSAILLNDGESK